MANRRTTEVPQRPRVTREVVPVPATRSFRPEPTSTQSESPVPTERHSTSVSASSLTLRPHTTVTERRNTRNVPAHTVETRDTITRPSVVPVSSPKRVARDSSSVETTQRNVSRPSTTSTPLRTRDLERTEPTRVEYAGTGMSTVRPTTVTSSVRRTSTTPASVGMSGYGQPVQRKTLNGSPLRVSEL